MDMDIAAAADSAAERIAPISRQIWDAKRRIWSTTPGSWR